MKNEAFLKTITGALAALASFLLSAPASLSSAAGVALWFLIVDSCAGLWLARRTGTMSSSAFRLKLKDKLVCYSLILGLAGGVGVLARTWAWPVAGFWALVAGEGISVGETLRAGLKLSSAGWTAPVSALLDKLMGAIEEGKGAIKIPSDTEKETTKL
jgi:hypothetical protein